VTSNGRTTTDISKNTHITLGRHVFTSAVHVQLPHEAAASNPSWINDSCQATARREARRNEISSSDSYKTADFHNQETFRTKPV